jgi:hypothetical protein
MCENKFLSALASARLSSLQDENRDGSAFRGSALRLTPGYCPPSLRDEDRNRFTRRLWGRLSGILTRGPESLPQSVLHEHGIAACWLRNLPDGVDAFGAHFRLVEQLGGRG